MSMTRLFAVLAGLLILGCATWAVIDSAKLAGAHAALVSSLAIGTAVGAFVMARSNWMAGLAIALAVVCGEGYGMLMTAERIVAMREAAQAPARRMAEQQTKVKERLTAAEAALAAMPAASPRLEAAIVAKGEADRAAINKAAEKSCSENCRKLLEAAVASARIELDDARREIADQRNRLGVIVDTERTAITSLQMPPSSGTALADRLGLAPWLLDLMAACLLTLGANGLAAVLIAWGSHVASATPTLVPMPEQQATNLAVPFEAHAALPVQIETPPEGGQPVVVQSVAIPARAQSAPAAPEMAPTTKFTSLAVGSPPKPRLVASEEMPIGSVVGIMVSLIEPGAGRTEIADAYSAYQAACAVAGKRPIGPDAFADPIAKMCKGAGIKIEVDGDDVYLVGVKIKQTSRKRVLANAAE
jgi:hypothetical protein